MKKMMILSFVVCITTSHQNTLSMTVIKHATEKKSFLSFRRFFYKDDYACLTHNWEGHWKTGNESNPSLKTHPELANNKEIITLLKQILENQKKINLRLDAVEKKQNNISTTANRTHKE